MENGAGDATERLVVLGVDSRTSAPVVEPITEAAAAAAMLVSSPDLGFAPAKRPPLGFDVPDPFDPREVGWVVVVGRDDPARDEMVRELEALALTRGGPGSWGPIDYPPGANIDQWLKASINTRDPVPAFVLLAGSPSHLPFALQSALACIAYVGRLDFSTVTGGEESQDSEAFGSYVNKILRNDRGETAPVRNDFVVWAPVRPRPDPTMYSRHLLAAPMADRIEAQRKFSVARLFDADATAAKLGSTVAAGRPYLLFTASHGDMVDASLGVDAQAGGNGALVGQDLVRFGADALPRADEAFLEGGLIIQFACFGYGTPSTSGYTHWFEKIGDYTAPFELVSALPKAAVAHPRGPIGYIAHADWALLHAFADPTRPGSDGTGALAPRLAPLRRTLDEALRARPAGAVLDPMAGQLGLLNLQLTNLWDDAKRTNAATEVNRVLVDRFLERNDARYYFLLGDPAARPRINDE
jgi:hypothetical protein